MKSQLMAPHHLNAKGSSPTTADGTMKEKVSSMCRFYIYVTLSN
jgi:hypothetical protein